MKGALPLAAGTWRSSPNCRAQRSVSSLAYISSPSRHSFHLAEDGMGRVGFMPLARSHSKMLSYQRRLLSTS